MGRALGWRAIAFLVGGLIAVAPGSARAQDPLAPRASEHIELIRNVPLEHNDANGGRLVGRHFYVTTGADLTIFDVSNPESPVQVGHMYFDGDVAWEQLAPSYYLTGYEEDVDTNGRVLLRADGRLQVVDVSDPKAPKTIGELEGISQHTISCVLDCTWAYGSEGVIVDLRDPTRPVEAGDWTSAAAEERFGHDVTEVAPGIVLTATDPLLLLDARTDPANPTVLAEADAPGFVHGTHWPNRMTDRFALTGGEAVGPACDDSESATFATWDTTGWQQSGTFRLADEYRVTPGTIEDGRHVESRYCGHWFDPHPAFRDGGLVSIAWYEHGTRLVSVGSDGGLEEVGWFLPPDGWAWAAYWITDRIVYVADHHRGIDILRFNGELPAAAPAASTVPPQPPAPASAAAPELDDLLALPSCLRGRRLTVRARSPERLQRVELRVRGRRPLIASGRALHRPLRLRVPARRSLRVRLKVVTAQGERVVGRRSFRSCRNAR